MIAVPISVMIFTNRTDVYRVKFTDNKPFTTRTKSANRLGASRQKAAQPVTLHSLCQLLRAIFR